MVLKNYKNDVLFAIKGQFSPEQFGARLFMDRDDILNPNNYLVWFHERFHYLQSIFTPYGHLKWGAYRSYTAEVINIWKNISEETNCKKRIPIAEYIKEKDDSSLKIVINIWMQTLLYQLYNILEQGKEGIDLLKIFNNKSFDTCPVIKLTENSNYRLKGIDIVESYAKFEEAMMAEILLHKPLGETIDESVLNPEYYSALYYFIDKVGAERLAEFPLVCELSLATAHIPSFSSPDKFYLYAPNWRFVKIIDFLSCTADLPKIDYSDNDSFYKYANYVLEGCGYESYGDIWDTALRYAEMADMSIASEMKDAIEYKRNNPWMLSYPMCSIKFMTEEFNRFEPYYTITDNGVMYNTKNISHSELIFELNFQALASQICGKISSYCTDTSRLMCGYSYAGIKTCPYYINGKCDGYIDKDSELLNLKLDEDQNLVEGCEFELFFKSMDLSIKNICVGQMRSVRFEDIDDFIKKK